MINNLLNREGGFVDHPADRGGPTNWGITQQTLTEVLGREATVDDVRNLTREDAAKIYARRYVKLPRFDQIDDKRLQELVVDCGVNHGVTRAAKWLQASVGVEQDGRVGPVTLEAVNNSIPQVLYNRVLAARVRFYGRLITDDPKQAAFAAGWADRVAGFLE